MEVYTDCYGTYRDVLHLVSDVFGDSIDVPLTVHVTGCPIKLSTSRAAETVRELAGGAAARAGIAWPAQSVHTPAPTKRVRLQNVTPFWQHLTLRCVNAPAPSAPALVRISDTGKVSVHLPTDEAAPNSTAFAPTVKELRVKPHSVETVAVDFTPKSAGPLEAAMIVDTRITYKRDSRGLPEGTHPHAEPIGRVPLLIPFRSAGVTPKLDFGDGKIRLKHIITAGPESLMAAQRVRQIALTNRTEAGFVFSLRSTSDDFTVSLLSDNTRHAADADLLRLQPGHSMLAEVRFVRPLLREPPGPMYAPQDCSFSGELEARFGSGATQQLMLTAAVQYPGLTPDITTVDFPETMTGTQRSQVITLTNPTAADARYSVAFVPAGERDRAKRNVRSALGRERARSRGRTDVPEPPAVVQSDIRTGEPTRGRRSARSARGYTRLMSPHPRDLPGCDAFLFAPVEGTIPGHGGAAPKTVQLHILFRPTQAVRYRASYFVSVAYGRGVWVEIVGEGSDEECHMGEPLIE